jgi:hypothetical protein
MEYVVKIPLTKVERGHLHVNRNFEEIDFAQQFICTSFRNRQNSELSASFSGLFRSEYK